MAVRHSSNAPVLTSGSRLNIQPEIYERFFNFAESFFKF